MSGYPSGLTVDAFEVVLHYYISPYDVPDALTPGTRYYTALKVAESAYLVELNPESAEEGQGSWRLTERGVCLAQAIMELRLPEQRWAMPRAP